MTFARSDRTVVHVLTDLRPEARVDRTVVHILSDYHPPARVDRVVVQILIGFQEVDTGIAHLRMKQRDIPSRQRQVTSRQQSSRIKGNTYI